MTLPVPVTADLSALYPPWFLLLPLTYTHYPYLHTT